MIKYLLAILATTALFLLPTIARAQTYQPSNRTPVADNSQIRTQVSGANNNFKIEGGLQRGQNLFHSFTDFSVPTNGSANFTNPTGNQSIITRVTGNLFSDINGLVKTNGANFLLINPSGVVFGSGVKLDVGKSFVTSTANGINLVDGSGRTIVFGTNPNGDAPLLTINPNVSFNVSSLIVGGGNGQVKNFGTLQTNNDSQYIGLIGGNVSLNGGKIFAPGGRVDIGGLNTNGTMSVNGDGLVFNSLGLTRSDVSIANNSSISVRAKQTLNPVDPVFFSTAISPGSSINISANRIDLTNSGNRFLGDKNNPINQDLGGLDAGLDVNSGVKTGKIGNIKLDATGDIKIQRAAMFNLVRSGAQGIGGGIKITGNNITVTDRSEISTNLSENAVGRGGDIEINALGNFNLTEPNYPDVLKLGGDAQSVIAASTYGRGNSGKVKIAASGSLVVSDSNTIASTIESTGAGDSEGIEINASSFSLLNGSQILSFANPSETGQKGNAGNIDIITTGDIIISGSKDRSVLTNIEDRTNPLSKIANSTFREGNAGKITLVAPGKLSIVNRGAIRSRIEENGSGNSGGIKINVGEMLLSNLSEISSSVGTDQEAIGNAKGNAGDINIKAIGNITINEDRIVKDLEENNDAASLIASNVNGTGNGGKVEIETLGKVSIGNRAVIASTVEAGLGNGGEIKINAGELEVFNQAQILAVAADPADDRPGNAGNINIKTIGNITIAGNINPAFVKENSNSFITKIASSSFRNGNAGKITIDAGGNVSLLNKGGIVTECKDGCKSQTIGNSAGSIKIKSRQLNLDRGDISLAANDNGGNITIATQDAVLMRRNSSISTNSRGGGDGGNITIDSKLVIAAPKENNDITANAIKGQGGNVNIKAQGVFEIQFRSQQNDNTNDITASSEFGRSGNVEIETLGTDPGKNKGELVAAPNDASNQISQACGASQRDNKFYITGRGGLPPNASEPQESDALWSDARAVKATPATTADLPRKYPPPAIGWVLEQNGRVRLIAAQTELGSTETRVVCPNR
ncbi:filamentous hemagglutinin N-terminal domain-containing protein [Chamaesiphon sp. VAR_48_metabat_135_sub]|uniref:two-partner secretion domain-containing protein n=1 Tax=Chamaesiphon sp. VAR_48_metabat_135_sub TaxID=2964699 RepID=UPI00286B45E6|nr:filamentous hemagglutinin N-terminal domain-containing protein [Chamaesiphon sp. VAR_48_metabat_135_sub]